MPADTIALDVAILLAEPEAQLVGELNARIRERNPSGFAFDTTHLPHITLLQQGCPLSDLAAIIAAVDRVVAGRPPLELEATGLEARGSSGWLTIAPTVALHSLHESLLDALAPFANTPIDAASFWVADDELPRAADLAWVHEYREQSSRERFAPHVSLGVGPPVGGWRPHRFSANRVAICHLGRHCTCRQVLHEWQLR